jgi:hypothetical protein
MLGHLGWVQFSDGVSANTHMEFSLEILMTIAPILDEGGAKFIIPFGRNPTSGSLRVF